MVRPLTPWGTSMAIEMIGLFGIVLFFVGSVLFVNGMAMFGHGDSKGAAPINFFVGGLTLLVNFYMIFMQPFGDESFYFGATGLLFSFTYLWNAINQIWNLDNRAFGWFCLFVALSAAPTSAISFTSDWRFGVFWASWGVLWFLYFLALSVGKNGRLFTRFTAGATILVAIATCWIPGYFILTGHW